VGRVDVIYIDPPYNTGAHDWKHNNRYVDSNDPVRLRLVIQQLVDRSRNCIDL